MILRTNKKVKSSFLTLNGRIALNRYYLLPNSPADKRRLAELEGRTNVVSLDCYLGIGWLIEHFTEDELRSAEEQLHQVKASSKLTGNAAYICKEHKSALKTVKVSAILVSVEKAVEAYPGYVGNKTQRERVRTEETSA